MTDAHAPGDHPTEQADSPASGQLALSAPEAHVRVVLDRRTREIGLANVAAIKRALAASAARRSASDRHRPPSGSAA